MSDVNPADDPETMEGWKRKTTPPIVIDRYHFKEDRDGYLTRHYTHLAVFDLATRAATAITAGQADDHSPSWSPDGTRLAFLSKRAHPDPDRTNNDDVWVVDAKAGATPRQMTNTPQAEAGRPVWSPDGSRLAILVGDDDTHYAYELHKLAVLAANAPGPTAPRFLSPGLDRAVSNPSWSKDGQRVSFLLEDDRSQYAASVPAEGGPARRFTTDGMVVSAISPVSQGVDRHAAVLSTSNTLPEVWALDGGAPRRLSHHNEALENELQLVTAEGVTSTSKDGTEVHSLLMKPVGYVAGRAYPMVVYIHGGPNGQDEHSFSFTHQWLAASGYVVLSPNYRGSSGRGERFQKAIHADWGHRAYAEMHALQERLVAARADGRVGTLLLTGEHPAVVTLGRKTPGGFPQTVGGTRVVVVEQGLADPARLGIGGWSYGGITTNSTIAADTRFKAAVSGAGSALQTSMYGIDQYTMQYEVEIGAPWKARDRWLQISSAFFNADRIRTPTLFMGGEKDFNVPIAGSEQMYQALKTLGVDTQLVIYPGQFHGLTTPSYERDRLQRYADWYGRYLQPAAATAERR